MMFLLGLIRTLLITSYFFFILYSRRLVGYAI